MRDLGPRVGQELAGGAGGAEATASCVQSPPRRPDPLRHGLQHAVGRAVRLLLGGTLLGLAVCLLSLLTGQSAQAASSDHSPTVLGTVDRLDGLVQDLTGQLQTLHPSAAASGDVQVGRQSRHGHGATRASHTHHSRAALAHHQPTLIGGLQPLVTSVVTPLITDLAQPVLASAGTTVSDLSSALDLAVLSTPGSTTSGLGTAPAMHPTSSAAGSNSAGQTRRFSAAGGSIEAVAALAPARTLARPAPGSPAPELPSGERLPESGLPAPGAGPSGSGGPLTAAPAAGARARLSSTAARLIPASDRIPRSIVLTPGSRPA